MINKQTCKVTYLRNGFAINSTEQMLVRVIAEVDMKSAFQYIYRELPQVVIWEVK